MKTTNKLSIFGLWHLGSVTAACCAKHFDVIAYDPSTQVVSDLNSGIAPIYEPELNNRLKTEIASKNLQFTNNLVIACEHSDIFWVTYDTPVDDNDLGDIVFICNRIDEICKAKTSPATIIISSQITATTCSVLEKQYPQHTFVCIPENLRLGKGIETFENAERFVVGCRDKDVNKLTKLLSPFNVELIFMKTESAEMVKHTINSFLALSVAFINEIATVCEQVNADAHEVSVGVKSDRRIGKGAYLKPGEPFAGGTLARDVVSLNHLQYHYNLETRILNEITKSNIHHFMWYIKKLNNIKNIKSVLFIGLTYTENTDTLRRSNAIKLYKILKTSDKNIKFYAYDTFVKTLPSVYNDIQLVNTIDDLEVDAVVVFGQQSTFKLLNYNKLKNDNLIHFIDANRYLSEQVSNLSNIKYINVGSPKSL
jgi:UDPglucose 6-dehydrogenase